MECKFAIKYGDKRSFLAKVYPRLTSSVKGGKMGRWDSPGMLLGKRDWCTGTGIF